MDSGWLAAGAVDAIWTLVPWLRQQPPLILIGVPAVVLVAVQILRGLARRRRHPGSRSWPMDRGAPTESPETLKEKLRLRLAEPAVLVDGPAAGAPTMGARQVLESDIDAAARSVLAEARGRRGKAKELLRHKVEGNGATNGKLNGSEASYWRQLGALSLIDSTRDALFAYQRAADLKPDDPELQMLLGVLSLRAGKLDAAEVAFRRQIKLGQGPQGGAERYRGATMLGDVLLARQSPGEALAAYQEAQREVLALLEKDAENSALQRDLSIACDRIGDVLLSQRDLDGALASFGAGLEIAEVLAKRNPANARWQHDLSVSYDRLGDVLERKADFAGALEKYRQGFAIAERLARRHPGRLDRQWDLSGGYERVGDVLWALGKQEKSLDSYRKGLAIAAAAAARDPDNVGWQRDLAASYHKIGSLESARRNSSEARDLLEKGRAIIARLERIASLQAQWRADLSRFDEALRTLGA
jgi:tetratricopeptide (TPR) repeat protein